MTDRLKEIGARVNLLGRGHHIDIARIDRQYLYDLVQAMLPVVEAAKAWHMAEWGGNCRKEIDAARVETNFIYPPLNQEEAALIDALAALEAKEKCNG